MKYIQYLLLIIFVSVLGGVTILHAQEECDIDTADVIEVVEEVCTNIGENQVCYGNSDVGADLSEDALELELEDELDFTFESVGDIADLINIESLYLSALNPEEDTWGIAQMRLVTPTNWGTQELNLLLFGDVEIENTVEATLIIEVQVGTEPANIRNLPAIDAIVLQSVESGTLLEAVGRLEDSSWIRVRTLTGGIGWIAAELITPANEGDDIDDLEVQDDSSPYFGPMQAFYFEQGSGSACGNITSDGLLVQTPQGTARVNVSINGVNIQLVPGQTGATALIEGDDSGMTISMIEGDGIIESGGTAYHLAPGEETTVASGGQPTIPSTYDTEAIDSLPTLSLVTTTEPLIARTAETTDDGGTTDGGTTDGGTTDGGTTDGGTTDGGTTGECNANANANANACD